MKNNIWFVVACVLVFCVGYNLNDTAISVSRYRVAVVDVAEVLSRSQEMKTLKVAQDKETQELNTLISKAQNELLNESDKTKFLQKEAEYRKQIEAKKNEVEEKYSSKLSVINDNIKSVISKEAKKENYNLVLPAGMVIVGGEDITSKVINQVK